MRPIPQSRFPFSPKASEMASLTSLEDDHSPRKTDVVLCFCVSTLMLVCANSTVPLCAFEVLLKDRRHYVRW